MKTKQDGEGGLVGVCDHVNTYPKEESQQRYPLCSFFALVFFSFSSYGQSYAGRWGSFALVGGWVPFFPFCALPPFFFHKSSTWEAT